MDFCGLVRRDHDDLDLALRAMADLQTPGDQLAELLDVLRLALAVHIVAESRVIGSLLGLVTQPPDALRWIAAQLRDEHAVHQAAAEELAVIEPGTEAWYDRALKLRITVLDHATRQDLMRTSLEQHVPLDGRRLLAARYATERLGVLATTSPLEMARRNVRAA